MKKKKFQKMLILIFEIIGQFFLRYFSNFRVLFRHCMIKFDPLTIFIIGGIQDRSVSNKTWIVNPMDDFKMRPGHSEPF